MQLDPVTKTLKREGVANEVSAFDVRALLKAVQLKSAHGGEVVAITMGPPGAHEALLECLALGADSAIHLNDRAFAGADTLATARALALALKRERFDLIFCGRNSVDAETGHIGPQIAEMLGLPQVTCARSLSIELDGTQVRAEREHDDGIDTVTAPLPAVITAAEDLAAERFANKAEREAAKTKPILELTANDLASDSSGFGAAGSPTWVSGLHAAPSNRLARMVEGSTPEELAAALTSTLIQEHGLFGSWKVPEPEAIAHIEKAPPDFRCGPIWVLVEPHRDGVRPVTLELLGKARLLADALRTEVTAVCVGEAGERYLPDVAAHGADRLLLLEHPGVGPFDAEVYATVLADTIRPYQPAMFLLGATSLGRDLAPRLAARLQIGLTSDCVDLGLDEAGRLIQYKPAFGGLIVAPILSRTLPAMATVRPGMLAKPEPDPTRQALVEHFGVKHAPTARVQLVARNLNAGTATDLDNAEIILGVGHGIGSRDNLAAIEPLAQLLAAPLCTTRDVTDAGWMPKQLQVGITGRAIAPKLYVAIAIRGAFEHMVGVRRAGIVVAINKSPKAPIFKSCDYGVVGDYVTLVPALTHELTLAKQRLAGA